MNAPSPVSDIAALPAPIGRRERKKLETRAALQAAALRLFAEQGYKDTRISDITEAADVSEATFFRYFATKEDVALDGIKSRIDGVVEALIAQAAELAPIEACLQVIDTPDGLTFAPTPAHLAELLLLAEHPTLSGHFLWHMSVVTERLATDFATRLGQRPTDLMPRVLANSVIGTLNAVLQVWVADTTVDSAALTRTALTTLAQGLEPATA